MCVCHLKVLGFVQDQHDVETYVRLLKERK